MQSLIVLQFPRFRPSFQRLEPLLRGVPEGPTLGRPIVDRVKGSSLHHLKELRPGSARASEIRILFAFDPGSNAVLLVAGDKAGSWRRWYTNAIPLAEQRFNEWIKEAGA